MNNMTDQTDNLRHFIPLCDTTLEALNAFNRNAKNLSWGTLLANSNPGLVLNKYCVSLNDRDKDSNEKFLNDWAGYATKPVREWAKACRKRRDLQIQSLNRSGWAAARIEAHVVWRMIIGLGGNHPYETGLTLHPTYGFPHIPGSAIKGLTRHYRLWEIGAEIGVFPVPYAEVELRHKSKVKRNTPIEDLEALLTTPRTDSEAIQNRESIFNRLRAEKPEFAALRRDSEKDIEDHYGAEFHAVFGSQEGQGAVTFLDAIPFAWQHSQGQSWFELDVMNPHFGDYYSKKSAPSDWSKPNPIPFVTIGRNTCFQFDLFSRNATLASSSKEWLERALLTFGIGGKTGAGYGEMEVLPGA